MNGRWLHWLERLLLGLGVVCLVYWGWAMLSSEAENAYQSHRLDVMIRRHERHVATATPLPTRLPGEGEQAEPAVRRPRDPLIGRIDIPRVGVSCVIMEGDDSGTLRHAVGHIPGTALPGDPGHAALAGHRDSYFRGLRRIKPDDVITITRPDGTYRYRVRSTEVVRPNDVAVLQPKGHSTLTLVTCYPFHYIGPAPRRFVVIARREEDASPTSSTDSARVAK
jgi:sortase A